MSGNDIPEAARAAQERAGQCIDERRFVEAIPHAETAARLCPDWGAPWWSLTVGYKHARRWREVLDACDRAVVINPDDAQGPNWNAGIAATALGEWQRARAAWAAVGVSIPPGDGPIVMSLGPVPIRVSPAGQPDVVWCDRLDPCRARIVSVPIAESQRRHGDLVLHDGEPRGTRRLGERTRSVFDELDVLEESPFHTWEAVVDCASRVERDAWVDELEKASLVVEDWTENLVFMCAACSLGDAPEPHHDHPAPEGWEPKRRLGVAARSETDLRPLRRARFFWRHGVLSVERVL